MRKNQPNFRIIGFKINRKKEDIEVINKSDIDNNQ